MCCCEINKIKNQIKKPSTYRKLSKVEQAGVGELPGYAVKVTEDHVEGDCRHHGSKELNKQKQITIKYNGLVQALIIGLRTKPLVK